MPSNNTTPPNLQSLNNYPDWYTDYGEAPTSSPPALNDLIYDAGYDPGKVLDEWDSVFEDYDPTREQFAQGRLENQEQALQLNYDQAVGQTEREQALIQAQVGPQGYLAQALGRQRQSLGIQKADALSAQQRLEGYFDPGAPGERGQMVKGARQIAQEQVGIQRGLAEDEQGFALEDYETQMGEIDPETGKRTGGRFGLREEEIGASAARQQAQLTDRLTSLGIDEAEAERQAASQVAGVGREEERLGLARGAAEEASQFQLDRLGRQREQMGLQERQDVLARSGIDLSGRGVSMQEQEAEAGLTQLQTQIGQRTGSARQQMMQAYQAAEMDTSGFAGAGARDIAQQRAIQAYAGDAAAGMQGLRARGESLRRGLGQFDIERERLDLQRGELDISADRRGIGERDLRAQELKEKSDLERQLSQYDVTSSELAARTEDIQGGLAAQQQRIGINVGAVNRGVADVAETEARQLASVNLDRGAQQTSYDRKLSQLGGQLSGLDLQDASNKLRFDEQAGRLESQVAQLGIQTRGAEAEYNERTGTYESRLEGIEGQLGEGGFLQRGLQNQLGSLGGRFAEEVYGLRDQYGDEVRGRILDLIQNEGMEDDWKVSPRATGTGEDVYDTMFNQLDDTYPGDDGRGDEGQMGRGFGGSVDPETGEWVANDAPGEGTRASNTAATEASCLAQGGTWDGLTGTCSLGGYVDESKGGPS